VRKSRRSENPSLKSSLEKIFVTLTNVNFKRPSNNAMFSVFSFRY